MSLLLTLGIWLEFLYVRRINDGPPSVMTRSLKLTKTLKANKNL